MRRSLAILGAMAVLMAAGCTGAAPAVPAEEAPPRLAPSPAASGPAPQPPAGFHGEALALSPRLRERFGTEFRRHACPVPARELRLLEFGYWGFDGSVRRGKLVIAESQAGAVLGVFHRLFRHGFPLQRVRLIDPEQGKLRLPGRVNVTAGYDCRWATGNRGVWSQHAFGLAIDVNPVENPYVKDGRVKPRKGKAYVDRSLNAPGMVHEGDVVVRAFARIGWHWGGDWHTLKDYMHFSLTGT